MHQKIRDISSAEGKEMGFAKGTLYYLKKNVEGNRPFTMNKPVRERLTAWEAAW